MTGTRMLRTILVALFWGMLALTRADAAPARIDRTGQVEAFEKELQQIANALGVPGYGYAIVADGELVDEGAYGVSQQDRTTPFTNSSPLRIASVTKALTATLAMKLVEEGKLDLSAPANLYLKDGSLPESVQVQHLLTHSSEGVPGDEYVYGTVRYSKLQGVIERASGQTLEQALRCLIIERSEMDWHSADQLGAHGGLVSTVRDMGKFAASFDAGELLGKASMRRLETASELRPGRTLPISLGWFVQEVQGEPVMWSYGQDDPDHSGALLIRLPERKLSLFLLANSNVISDAFRLLMGDVRKSPFAMSFLRIFAFSDPKRPLLALPTEVPAGPGLEAWLDSNEARTRYRYSDELAARALSELWVQRKDAAQALIDLMLRRYRLEDVADPVLHFAAMQIADGAGDKRAIGWGRKLLAEHPNNRWILLSQGYLLQRAGDKGEAAQAFERIIALPNQEDDFLHKLFGSWAGLALAEMVRERDPAKARAYLQAVVDSGVKGPTLESAEQALIALGN